MTHSEGNPHHKTIVRQIANYLPFGYGTVNSPQGNVLALDNRMLVRGMTITKVHVLHTYDI